MLAGVGLGYLLRNHNKLIQIINKSVFYIILLLLFIMGISIGANKLIIQHFSLVGWRGLQLSLVATMGSILLTGGLYLLFFKEKNGRNER